MPLLRDQAFVLRLTDFSESSQVVTLLTRQHGVVRVLARGVRRSTRARPAVGLDLLERGEASFLPAREAGALGTLTEWSQQGAFLGLRRDLPRLFAALYAIERIPALTAEMDPQPALFDALASLLDALARPDAAGSADKSAAPSSAWPPEALVRYQAALLRSIGLTPNLRTCGVCGRPRTSARAASFSSAAGGYVCARCAPRCAEKRSLPAALLGPDPARAPPRLWFDLLDYHLTHLAGRPSQAVCLLRRRLASAAGARRATGQRAAIGPPDGELSAGQDLL